MEISSMLLISTDSAWKARGLVLLNDNRTNPHIDLLQHSSKSAPETWVSASDFCHGNTHRILYRHVSIPQCWATLQLGYTATLATQHQDRNVVLPKWQLMMVKVVALWSISYCSCNTSVSRNPNLLDFNVTILAIISCRVVLALLWLILMTTDVIFKSMTSSIHLCVLLSEFPAVPACSKAADDMLCCDTCLKM